MPRVGLCGEDALFVDALSLTLAPLAEIAFRARTHEECMAALVESVDVVVIAGIQKFGLIERWAHDIRFHEQTRFIAIGRPPPNDVGARWIEAGACAFLDDRAAGPKELVDSLGAALRGERWFSADALEAAFHARPSQPMVWLSERERSVLAWLAGGADNLQIAARLGMTERTVKSHVSRLYRKLACENRARLSLKARELGFAPPPSER